MHAYNEESNKSLCRDDAANTAIFLFLNVCHFIAQQQLKREAISLLPYLKKGWIGRGKGSMEYGVSYNPVVHDDSGG